MRVCKEFYASTLDIGMKTIRCTIKRKTLDLHTPANKTTSAARQGVKKHIEFFPAVNSHYIRKGPSRLILAADFRTVKPVLRSQS